MARKLVTVAQASDILSVEVVTVRRWVREGKLPAYRVGGRAIRLDAADLDSLVTRVGVAK